MRFSHPTVPVVCTLLLLAACSHAFSEEPEKEEPKVKVNFAGIDLATLAKQVERVTGKSFLFDENLLRSKKVTLQSESSITAKEFYRVFQAVCQTNDLVMVPVDNAGLDLVKIVKTQGAFKEPGRLPVLTQGTELPADDSLASFLVKLKHVPPQKVMPALTPNLSSTGAITQIPNTDLLMISDVSSSLRRAQKLLEVLDVPGEPVQTVSVTVANLPGEKAAAMLTEYMQAIEKAKNGTAGTEKVAILKDERLNVLHLIGPQADVKRAEAFLKDIDKDVPTSRRTVEYYKLKNVPVLDVVEYVAPLLGVALEKRAQPQVAEASPVGAAPAQQPPGTQPQAAPQPPQPAPTAQNAGVRTGAPPRTVSATALGVELIPVEGLNTLVVAGDGTIHKAVREILDNLDKRKGQVLIEVAVIQVTGDQGLDLGAEFLRATDVKGGNSKLDGGTGFGIGTQSDPTGRGFPTAITMGGISGAALRFAKDQSIQAVLSMVASKSNVSIVSQPLLLVNDNEQAEFTTKVSEPTITTSQGTATTETSFSGFADATTSLKITPHISAEGYLNLNIVQTFEEFTGASAGAGIPPPKVSNNTNTKITIPDRQTIIIGGFVRDSSTKSKRGIPGLMNVPGIGKLFSRENEQKTTSRLYLFVRPKILATTDFEDLKGESSEKKDDIEDLSKKSKIRKEIKDRIGRGEPRAEFVPLEEKKGQE